MEIPNSDIYENNLEEEFSAKKELLTNIDFFDERLDLTFSLEKEVEQSLPEITDEEMEAEQERFRILLGKPVQFGANKVNIKIKGLLEIPEGEREDLYSENEGEIAFNMGNIKEYVREFQKNNPNFRDWYFVGDLHTHPIKKSDLSDWQNTWDCSPIDFECLCKIYDQGRMSPDEPYIFGIGGRNEEGDTAYSFYRFFKIDGQYVVEEINEL